MRATDSLTRPNKIQPRCQPVGPAQRHSRSSLLKTVSTRPPHDTACFIATALNASIERCGQTWHMTDPVNMSCTVVSRVRGRASGWACQSAPEYVHVHMCTQSKRLCIRARKTRAPSSPYFFLAFSGRPPSQERKIRSPATSHMCQKGLQNKGVACEVPEDIRECTSWMFNHFDWYICLNHGCMISQQGFPRLPALKWEFLKMETKRNPTILGQPYFETPPNRKKDTINAARRNNGHQVSSMGVFAT